MKIVLGALLAVASAQSFAGDVSVSVRVGEPGFYGQIDLGNAPPPQVILSQPVIIEREAAPGGPIYLRVPPGHEKHWRKHCHEYNACGRQVYFVRDDWYQNVYAPHYREHRSEYREDRDEGRDERHHGNHGHHGRDKDDDRHHEDRD